MKIICLIRPYAPPVYFVNRINESHKVSLAIVESVSVKRKLIEVTKSGGIWGTIEALRDKALASIKPEKHIKDYDKYFGNKWCSISNDIPVQYVEDINAPIVFERLKKEKPDLILDHGTSLLKDHIIETAILALNLHWGLSPYYRGVHCTEWAIINWDPFNIGVTVHSLSRVIDGGGIVAQRRAVIGPGDTVNSINMQLTQLGTELMIKIIDRIESGEKLKFKQQDYSLGFSTLNRQWSKYLERQSHFIERNKLIELMLKKPARKQELPMVEL